MNQDKDSYQINYTHKTQGEMTACVEAQTALTVAKFLHDQGHDVGSIGWYEYPSRNSRSTKVKTVEIWYASDEGTYYKKCG